MDVLRWQDEPIEALGTGIGRRMVNGEAMTLARSRWPPAPRSRSTSIRTSKSRRFSGGGFLVGAEECEVGPGESVLIPGGVPHRVEALEDSVVLDAFAPRREDWLRGDDAYLRDPQK